MRRLITTRAQREALYRLFARYYDGFTTDLGYDSANGYKYGLGRAQRLFPNRAWYRLYRAYRRRFSFAGVCGDHYLFGQPYRQGENQLWVGIESDGYTHS